MSTTPGWLMVAIVRASPRNRSAKPGSSSRAGSRIFTATVRPSTSSVPRHTSPMPPPAIRSSSLYRPPSTAPPLTISTTSGSLEPPLGDHGLHHVAGDPGGLGAAARTGVLEEDRDRADRPAVFHDPPNEPAVVAVVLTVLCRSGLPADAETVDLRLGTRTPLDDALHHLLQVAGHLAVDRLPEDLGRGLRGRGQVGRLELVDQVRPHLVTAVGHRRRDQRGLHRGDPHVLLPDAGLGHEVRVVLPVA